MILEVIACGFDDARTAFEGGADRLELCARLDLAGLTPPISMVEHIDRAIPIPVRVMVRTNDGFTATPEEIECMEQQVIALSHLPIEGIVFGLLDTAGHLDFAAMDRVLHHAPDGWCWTLHRAFDYAAGNAAAKLAAVRKHGRADRVLTQNTPQGLSALSHLCDDDFQLLAGGGITAENLLDYVQHSGCQEFHVGRAARKPADTTAPIDLDAVLGLRAIFARK